MEIYDLEFDILNELYVGETKFIDKFIEMIHKAREPYVGQFQRAIKGDKNLLKIADMIKEEFGFGGVSFLVPLDTSLNAFTYPVTYSMDKSIKDTKPKFDSKLGMKLEPVNRLCTIISVTSGVWFSKEFTDREVAAAILHEVGHNFVSHSERLVPLIEAVKIANIIVIAYNAYIAVIKAMQGDTKDITQVVNDVAFMTNAGKNIKITIDKYISQNPLLYSISNLFETGSSVFIQIMKEISSVAFVNRLMAIPAYLVQMIIGILTKPITDMKRSQEYLSDSFAGMYGLAPEITSFLTKIEYNPSARGSVVEKIMNKIPVIGALNESLNISILMMMNTVSDHPSTLARSKKLIDELEKEMNNSDLSPSTKKAIKQNIEDLKKVQKQLIDADNKYDKKDHATVKAAWFKCLNNQGVFTNAEE